MGRLTTQARVEHWPLARPFVIARGASSVADVLVVEIADGAVRGRGEGCPISRYGETPQLALQQAEQLLARLREGAAWDSLHDAVRPGAARNAVDCAVWDLRAKQAGQPVWRLLGLAPPRPVPTALTISVGMPAAMAQAALAQAAQHATLKLKLAGGADDVERVAAVRRALPQHRLIVDANEAWLPGQLSADLPRLAALGVELLEQPLRAGHDAALADLARAQRPVPIAADESCHTSADAARCAPLYDVVNIKLDKSGGLTEALRLLRAAQAHGLQPMVGCMLGTSLAMAPALLVAQQCRFVDLDAPLLIGRDREHALVYRDGQVGLPAPALWG